MQEPQWIGYGGADRDRRRRLRKHNNRMKPQEGVDQKGQTTEGPTKLAQQSWQQMFMRGKVSSF